MYKLQNGTMGTAAEKVAELSRLLAESRAGESSETRWAFQYKTERDLACEKLEKINGPECWLMLKSSIAAARAALEAGIENTQELLDDHDVRLGRTTRSNRSTAERLESEIGQMQSAFDELKEPNGFIP